MSYLTFDVEQVYANQSKRLITFRLVSLVCLIIHAQIMTSGFKRIGNTPVNSSSKRILKVSLAYVLLLQNKNLRATCKYNTIK